MPPRRAAEQRKFNFQNSNSVSASDPTCLYCTSWSARRGSNTRDLLSSGSRKPRTRQAGRFSGWRAWAGRRGGMASPTFVQPRTESSAISSRRRCDRAIVRPWTSMRRSPSARAGLVRAGPGWSGLERRGGADYAAAALGEQSSGSPSEPTTEPLVRPAVHGQRLSSARVWSVTCGAALWSRCVEPLQTLRLKWRTRTQETRTQEPKHPRSERVQVFGGIDGEARNYRSVTQCHGSPARTRLRFAAAVGQARGYSVDSLVHASPLLSDIPLELGRAIWISVRPSRTAIGSPAAPACHPVRSGSSTRLALQPSISMERPRGRRHRGHSCLKRARGVRHSRTTHF